MVHSARQRFHCQWLQRRHGVATATARALEDRVFNRSGVIPMAVDPAAQQRMDKIMADLRERLAVSQAEASQRADAMAKERSLMGVEMRKLSKEIQALRSPLTLKPSPSAAWRCAPPGSTLYGCG